MRLGTRGGTLLLALALGASASADAAPDGLEPHGRALYRAYCEACHGSLADPGAVGRVATKRGAPPDLTRLAERHGTNLPKAKLVHEAMGASRAGHTSICGERIFAKLPAASAAELMKRGTLLTVLYYLETVQRTD